MSHNSLNKSLIGSIFFIASYSTIIHGNKQKVSFSSSPTAANIIIDGKYVGKTPLVVPLRRKQNHSVQITTSGYPPYKNTLQRKFDNLTLTNLYCAWVGFGVDAITGAMYKLVSSDSAAYLSPTPLQLQQTLINYNLSKPLLGRIIADKNDALPKLVPDKRNKYFIISGGFSKTFSNNITGTLTESFPYSFKDFSTNTTTAATFNGSIKSAFSSTNLIDIFNVEYVSKKHSINGGIGINSSGSDEYSVYLKGGYGLVLPLNFIKWNGKPFLLLKPSVNLLFAAGYNKSLGTIDNKNKEIYLFNYTAGQQFTTGDGTDDNPTETYDAGVLDVSFKNSRTMAVPKISITNRPTSKTFWGIDASWLLPISRSSNFMLTQKADNNNHNEDYLGRIDFNKNNSVTTLNNTTVKKSPSTGAFYFGVNIGVYLWPLKRK